MHELEILSDFFKFFSKKIKLTMKTPLKTRAVKFFTFCHPELAKDLLQQREILARDASQAQHDSEMVNFGREVFQREKQKDGELNSPCPKDGSRKVPK